MNDIVTELYSKYMEEIAFETAKRKKFRELNKKILEVLTAQKKLPNEVQEAIEKYEELNRLIQEQLDRGTTLVYTQTGYLKNDQPMILTVVSNRELMRLNQLVQETDPHAFMIIGNVNEVRGRGFSQQKVYKKEQEER